MENTPTCFAPSALSRLRAHFEADGFVVVRPCSITKEMLGVAASFTDHLARGQHYASRDQFSGTARRTRIQDGMMNTWRHSRLIHDIAVNAEVRLIIEALHGAGRRPWPVQTKQFHIGSAVPAHSDVVFLDTLPSRGLLVGAWLALEDVHQDAGPLQLFRGSHNASLWDFSAVGLTELRHPASGVAGPRAELLAYPYTSGVRLADPYDAYVKILAQILRSRGWQPAPALLRQGELLIWTASLIHGGAPIRTPNRTRRSMTVHYFLEGSDVKWSPLQSVRSGRLEVLTQPVIPATPAASRRIEVPSSSPRPER
jgi:ectoine hydroxylase-related dioxygenase (phytanoyl-CoA dioxygenase family)